MKYGFRLVFGLATGFILYATLAFGVTARADYFDVEHDFRYVYIADHDWPSSLLDFDETAVIMPAEQSPDLVRWNDHSIEYAVANQPGQNWRNAVDAYRHIDPGRSFA